MANQLTPEQQKAAAEQAMAQVADATKRAYILGVASNCIMYGADPQAAGEFAETAYKQACARRGRIKQATKARVVAAIKQAATAGK